MIKNIITFAILYAVHAANSIADDIEIYQSGDFGVRPNVMFLLDTSGSMEETVEFSKGPYDPDITYPGPFYTDRLYYQEFSVLGDWFNLDLDNEIFRKAMLGRYVHEGSLRCQTHEANLKRFGKVKAKFLQWDPNQEHETRDSIFNKWVNRKGVWKELKTTLDQSRFVDCKADIDNNHGMASNDHTYMTNLSNSQPYGPNKSDAVPNTDRIWWGGTSPNIFSLNRGYWLCLIGICAGATDSLYTGNYLNYDYYTGSDEVTEASRMYIMGAAIAEAVGTNPGLNVGLSRFDGRYMSPLGILFPGEPSGGMISIAMSKSEDSAKNFDDMIKSWDPYGFTPMSEAYYEVARYMRGESPVYGNDTMGRKLTGNIFQDTPIQMPSVSESRIANDPTGNYQTPITESCQTNHIIVFTDGEPTQDIGANNAIKSLTSGISLPEDLKEDCSTQGPLRWNGRFSDGQMQRGHGQCADDLAYFLANTDQIDDSKIDGIQSIITHTVGGFIATDQSTTADPILKSMAKYGEGTYSSIQSYEDMRKAFSGILGGILQNPVSFTAPVVSVNAFNSLELSDELYYSVFEPRNNLQWAGNLKRYRLATLESGGELVPAIVDSKGKNAIDSKTTFFNTNAQSFWTPDESGPDGEVVTSGGMANRLTTPRKTFTSKAGSKALVSLDTINEQQLNIATKVNQDPNYMRGLIAWANGYDTNKPEANGTFNTARTSMEDPLHSEPTIIKYSSTTSTTGEQSADRTLFIGTNSGYIHAFDVDENAPKEHFSFIPKELLQNLDKYYSGGTLYEHKAYGIDGPLTHWHQDSNGNGQVDNGEQVYLYITLRRGGQSLYALNVTDRTKPTLAWEKHGNYPANFPNKPAISDGYENLGQTWARMEPATVMWDNTQKVVLFTAGGYDPIEDGTDMNGPASRTTHSQGTTIYMIDAESGEVLWDANEHANMPSGMAMTSSFSANVAPIDTSGDGLADMIYAPDVGGRVWRFDITQPKINYNLPTSFTTDEKNFANGAAILDVSGGDSSGNRRFFNEVDVVYQKAQGGMGDSVLLSIGSGMRPHPLSVAVTNYHFVIKDELKAPDTAADYNTITFDQLTEYGTNNDYGWYVPLTYPGEKVLSRSNTFSNTILFATFAPNEVSTTTVNCNADPGRTMLYILQDGVSKAISIKQGGIPPSPTIIEIPTEKDDDGKKKSRRKRNVIVGTEIIEDTDADTGKRGAIDPFDDISPSRKNYWLEIASPEI